MTLSMSELPDCTWCGGPVVLEVDLDGAAEVCVSCGFARWPQPPVGWRQHWQRKVRAVAAMPIPEELR